MENNIHSMIFCAVHDWCPNPMYTIVLLYYYYYGYSNALLCKVVDAYYNINNYCTNIYIYINVICVDAYRVSYPISV